MAMVERWRLGEEYSRYSNVTVSVWGNKASEFPAFVPPLLPSTFFLEALPPSFPSCTSSHTHPPTLLILLIHLADAKDALPTIREDNVSLPPRSNPFLLRPGAHGALGRAAYPPSLAAIRSRPSLEYVSPQSRSHPPGVRTMPHHSRDAS